MSSSSKKMSRVVKTPRRMWEHRALARIVWIGNAGALARIVWIGNASALARTPSVVSPANER